MIDFSLGLRNLIIQAFEEPESKPLCYDGGIRYKNKIENLITTLTDCARAMYIYHGTLGPLAGIAQPPSALTLENLEDLIKSESNTCLYRSVCRALAYTDSHAKGDVIIYDIPAFVDKDETYRMIMYHEGF